MVTTNPIAGLASQYGAEFGVTCIPIGYRSKRPSTAWGEIKTIENGISAIKEAEGDDDKPVNLAWILGAPSGICDIDIDVGLVDDDPAFSKHVLACVARSGIIPTTRVFGRESKPQSHYLVKVDGGTTRRLKGFPGSKFAGVIVELRGNNKRGSGGKTTGAYTVVPGSVHPSGEPLRWENDEELVVMSPEEADLAVSMIQIGVQLSEMMTAGGRHDTAMMTAGTLAKLGVDQASAIKVISLACDICGDEELEDRLEAVRTTYVLHQDHHPCKTLASFESEVGGWDGIARWVAKSLKSISRDLAKPALYYDPSDTYQINFLITRVLRARPQCEWFESAAGPKRITEGKYSLGNVATLAADITEFTTWRTYAGDAPRRPTNADLELWLKGAPDTRKLSYTYGIVTNPVFDENWDLETKGGFNPITGYFYHSLTGKHFPEPKTDDASIDKAIADWKELLSGFPFDGDRDTCVSAVMASVLMTALGPTVGPRPLTIISANSQGSGKTHLAKLMTLIGTGRVGCMVGAAGNRAEMDKRITAAIIEGHRSLIFDNVVTQLDSPLLAQMLSEERVNIRPLGTSSMIECFSRDHSFFATGNSFSVDSDLSRRSMTIRLKSKVGTGKSLGHTFDPMKAAIDSRDELLSQLFGILQAYKLDGEAVDVKHVPTYGDLDMVVAIRGALIWAGLPDPFSLLSTEVEGVDEENDLDREFISLLHSAFGEDFFRSPQLADLRLYKATLPAPQRDLVDFLEENCGKTPVPTYVKRLLRKCRDRNIDNRYLEQKTVKGRRGYRILTDLEWSVENDGFGSFSVEKA